MSALSSPDAIGRMQGAGLASSLRRYLLGRDETKLHPLGFVLRVLLVIAALIPTVVLLFAVGVLLFNGWNSIIFNGFSFLTGKTWSFGNFYSSQTITRHGVSAPLGAGYGAAPIILGTLLTSGVALVLAVPISVGAAVMLVVRMPPRMRPFFSIFLELLAGIPSVVYGLWGLIVLGPFLARHVYPAVAHLGIAVPFFGPPTGSGLGLLTAGIVLAIMIIPIVASTTRDLLAQVPVLPQEGAVALGLTSWEGVWSVSLPWVSAGIWGAVLLGWARALGETMAVLIVSGNGANLLPQNIYGPVSTLASTIVALLDSAQSDPTGLAVSALAEAGLLLLLITLLTNVLARLLVLRVSSSALPVGRGV